MACASTQPSGINTLRQLCDFYGCGYESELLHSLNVWRREILIIKRGFILRFTNILEDIMFRYEGILIWHMKTRRQHKFNIRQIQRNFRIMGCLRRLYHRVILKYMRRIYEGLESKNVSARKFHRNIGALRTSLEQAREWITLLGGPSVFVVVMRTAVVTQSGATQMCHPHLMCIQHGLIGAHTLTRWTNLCLIAAGYAADAGIALLPLCCQLGILIGSRTFMI